MVIYNFAGCFGIGVSAFQVTTGSESDKLGAILSNLVLGKYLGSPTCFLSVKFMAEESKWSNLLKIFGDSLNFLRQILILFILVSLIFYPPIVANRLSDIGFSLADVGFSEVAIAGLKADLKAFRQKAQETKLNTGETQKIITKVLESLKKIEQPNKDVQEAIKEIVRVQDNLESIKEELKNTASTNDDQTQTVLSDDKPWVVVIGADRTPKDADWEKNKTINNEGFKGTEIIYRDDSYKWYRTVIPFATEQEAKEALPKIKTFQNDAFIRDLNKWCEKLEPKESNSVKYKICTPRKT